MRFSFKPSFATAICGVLCFPMLIAAPGCSSLSESSESSSAFVSSPITSFSRSSSPEVAYREEVRDFTEAHIEAGGDAASLRRGLGEVAARHGISDWESNEATYLAVGKGLARAGYNRTKVDAFASVFADSDEQTGWIVEGFRGK